MDWYCIHTRPQKEDASCAYYQETLGIETYAPKLRQQRVIRRVRRIVTRPLFPRYIFCRFEPALHYRAVKYAPDTVDVVHCGAAPAIVPDQLIHELKTWVGDAFDTCRTQPRFAAGDLVEIEAGPLMGLRAIVQQELSDSERVAVLLTFLDCGARTLVPRNQLRLVS
jgi:Transcription antiterminator